jgi:hypothetical protein
LTKTSERRGAGPIRHANNVVRQNYKVLTLSLPFLLDIMNYHDLVNMVCSPGVALSIVSSVLKLNHKFGNQGLQSHPLEI